MKDRVLFATDMFGSYFLKPLLIKFFENIENTILMLFEHCSCYLKLVFFVSSLFFRIKKKKKLMCSFLFLVLIVFQNKR